MAEDADADGGGLGDAGAGDADAGGHGIAGEGVGGQAQVGDAEVEGFVLLAEGDGEHLGVGRGRQVGGLIEAGAGLGGLAVGEQHDGREPPALDAFEDVADDGGDVGGVAQRLEGRDLGEARSTSAGVAAKPRGSARPEPVKKRTCWVLVSCLSQAASWRVAVARS